MRFVGHSGRLLLEQFVGNRKQANTKRSSTIVYKIVRLQITWFLFLTFRRLQNGVSFIFILWSFSIKLKLALNFLHKKKSFLPRHKQRLFFILLQCSGNFQCFLPYRNDSCNRTSVTRTKRKTTGNIKQNIRLKTQRTQILSATCNIVNNIYKFKYFFMKI